MILEIVKREPTSRTNWHTRFALLPKRISKTQVVWLQTYWRKLVFDKWGDYWTPAETHWEYRTEAPK